ncbi:MAG: hypothetical protein LBQ58_11110 [Synergistaceae bacterium]|jgi:hypothetical protein|nr:hypothetical protein [Synergistaceae bacterium]
MDVKTTLSQLVQDSGGLLRLKPALVTRLFPPPGRRLGLPDDAYDAGERGCVTERWLASTTEAQNPIHAPGEGLSFIDTADGAEISLRDAVEEAPDLIMGSHYANHHSGLGRLPKIFDNGDRTPFHIHQIQVDADKTGKDSKERSYYFPPDAPMGPHPEMFFGLHPFIVRERRKDIIARYFDDWENLDRILTLSRAYISVPDDAFHLPPGILHALGSALTIELREEPDAGAQSEVSAAAHDIPPSDAEEPGMITFVNQLDWEANGDPYFYENHHTPPVLMDGSKTASSEEWWIFYNTTKYSGTKLIVRPGCVCTCVDRGAYSILAWSGEGTFGELPMKGRSLTEDEVMVTCDRARSGVQVVNTGDQDLILFKFFGPDINDDAPMMKKYP